MKDQQYPLESIYVKLEEVIEDIQVSEARAGVGQPRRYSNSSLVSFSCVPLCEGEVGPFGRGHRRSAWFGVGDGQL